MRNADTTLLWKRWAIIRQRCFDSSYGIMQYRPEALLAKCINMGLIYLDLHLVIRIKNILHSEISEETDSLFQVYV